MRLLEHVKQGHTRSGRMTGDANAIIGRVLKQIGGSAAEAW